MTTKPLPVFHPDHPHNRVFTSPLEQTFDTNLPIPRMPRSRPGPPPSAFKTPGGSGSGGGGGGGGMSDSDASSSESPSRRRCFCGREVVDGGIYCSIDAFTSLCYKPGGPSTLPPLQHPIPSSTSAPTHSRQPSEESYAAPEWNASHYRRMARADSRREEKRDERRRRRAEGSVASSTVSLSTVSSATSSRVPDLVGGGGGGHSRNASTASTASSVSGWSSTSLSRNPSSASSVSSASRRYRPDNVAVIQEDDDEEEYLDTTRRPYPLPGARAQLANAVGFGHKKSRSAHARKKVADPMGMGKDMRDILEEIIEMEKSFNLDDEPLTSTSITTPPSQPPAGIFTAVFDKPPRTPSPIAHSRKRSVVPDAPIRGHRNSLSLSNHPGLAPPLQQRSRPSSLMGLHQSSLSESHTALYLATASPVAPSRRSASPKLRSRTSITFTPEKAGPAILAARYDSPIGPGLSSTPSARRRPQISPNAAYGTMDGWRFPAGAASTPRGQAQLPVGPTTTTSMAQTQVQAHRPTQQVQERTIPPHLLWPPPPLFPQSPGIDTPTFISALHARPAHPGFGGGAPGMPMGPAQDFRPPQSGMRLGVLLGSGEDVEMDTEDDDGSTAHGHGSGPGEYLPVFLEAEGFRQSRSWGM